MDKLTLLSLSRSSERYVTKQESVRLRLSAPTCPKLIKRRHYQVPYTVGYAKPIFFKREFILSSLYNKNEQAPYMEQIFSDITKIGEGSFGTVYKGVSRDDGLTYAIKKFDKYHNMINHYKEIQSFEKIGFTTHCLAFYGAWEERKELYIQMEYCVTNLAKYNLSHTFSEDQLWNILTDMLLALEHLHNQNLIHLDVKPDNILVSVDGVCKLGDFGLVVDLGQLKGGGKINRRAINFSEGDAKYVADEVLQMRIYTKACDIFSLGITILELATDLVLPCNGLLWRQLRSLTFPDVFYQDVPLSLQVVIQKMMCDKHKKRPSAREILQHHKIQGILKDRDEHHRVSYLSLPDVEEVANSIPTINCEPHTPPHSCCMVSNFSGFQKSMLTSLPSRNNDKSLVPRNLFSC